MPKITSEQAKDELTPVFRGWADAVGAVKDYAFLDRHLDDGWLYTDFNGMVRGKDEYYKLVDNIVSYIQKIQKFDVRTVSDDIAAVFGVYHALAELKNGTKLDNTIAFTSVWQLRDGVWKGLLHHTTRVVDPGSSWLR
jgi:ketosteroid isomerase-like protein